MMRVGLWVQSRDCHTQSDTDALLLRAQLMRATDLFFYPHEGPSNTLRRHYLNTGQDLILCDRITAGFDPLGYLITRAHALGLRVHAVSSPGFELWKYNANWNVRNSRGVAEDWSDFTIAAAISKGIDFAQDIAAHYAIDGIQVDLCRWTTGIYQHPYAWATQQAITGYVTAIRSRLAGVDLEFSAAVNPYANPETRTGQNWPLWMSSGYIDFACTMSYWRDEIEMTQYLASVWYQAFNRESVWIGVGANVFGTTTTHKAAATVVREIEAVYQAVFRNIALFDYANLGLASNLTSASIEKYNLVGAAVQQESIMSVITDLQAVETYLRAQATEAAQEVNELTAQADAVASAIVALHALDDQLDTAANALEVG